MLENIYFLMLRTHTQRAKTVEGWRYAGSIDVFMLLNLLMVCGVRCSALGFWCGASKYTIHTQKIVFRLSVCFYAGIYIYVYIISGIDSSQRTLCDVCSDEPASQGWCAFDWMNITITQKPAECTFGGAKDF